MGVLPSFALSGTICTNLETTFCDFMGGLIQILIYFGDILGLCSTSMHQLHISSTFGMRMNIVVLEILQCIFWNSPFLFLRLNFPSLLCILIKKVLQLLPNYTLP